MNKDPFLLEEIINTIPYRIFWKDKDLNFLGANRLFALDAGFEDAMQSGHLTRAQADAYNVEDLRIKIRMSNPDLCISTLEKGQMSYNASFAAAINGKNYVSSNFLTEDAREGLDKLTKQSAHTDHNSFEALLAENDASSAWGRGLDPGLDSWVYLQALEHFKGGEVNDIISVGAGISEKPEDIYFKTWEGITSGMGHRPATFIRNNEKIDVSATTKFAPFNRLGFENIQLKNGMLVETYMNDDGCLDLVEQAKEMGIDTSNIKFAATLTGRHVGHSKFWNPLVKDLNILDNTRVYEEEMSMKTLIKDLLHKKYETAPNNLLFKSLASFEKDLMKQDFLSKAPLGTGTAKDLTERHLSNIYPCVEGKSDLSIIFVRIEGKDAEGTNITKTLELKSLGDPTLSGHTSMQKTVAGTLVRTGVQTLEGKTPRGLTRPRHDTQNGKDTLEDMIKSKLITLEDHNPEIKIKHEPQAHKDEGENFNFTSAQGM